MQTFKEIVDIAGTKYEITDERVFKYYRLASELVRDKNRIVGFRLKNSKPSELKDQRNQLVVSNQ